MVRLNPVTLPALLEPGEYLFRRKLDGAPVMFIRLIAPIRSRDLADLLEQVKAEAA